MTDSQEELDELLSFSVLENILREFSMYLTKRGVFEKSYISKSIRNPHYEINWEGLVFSPGTGEGAQSVQLFLQSLTIQDSPQQIVKKTFRLRGSWSLFIHNLIEKFWILCTDHSHQSNVFYNADAASTSFLKLRDHEPEKSNVSVEAAIMVLYSGLCYSEKIVYDDIMKMDYRDFMIVRNGKNKISSKELGAQMAPIHESAQFTFHLDAFFASLRDHKICIDITGGTDTRALAIVLNHQGYAFDIAINGDKQFAETMIAEQVASQIGKKLKGYTIHENEIAEEDLRLAWQACDGLNLSLGSYLFEKWRKNFGYSLVVSGKGANLFKDDSFLRYAILFLLLQKDIAGFVDTLVKKGIMFWWARPFYELLNILSKDYRELATDIIEKKIAEITFRYRKYSLIESANRIFYEYSLNNPSGTTHELITRYCPYFEPEMVNIAVGLPILKRFNCYFYRNHVGKLHPGAAKIRTHPYGHKMSGSFSDIVFDYAYLLKQTLLKTLKPDVISKRAPDINLQKIQRYVFEHPDMARGLSDLKKKGIINRNLELHQMNLRLATNVLQLHYLMEQ